jgi:hypothetical protein
VAGECHAKLVINEKILVSAIAFPDPLITTNHHVVLQGVIDELETVFGINSRVLGKRNYVCAAVRNYKFDSSLIRAERWAHPFRNAHAVNFISCFKYFFSGANFSMASVAPMERIFFLSFWARSWAVPTGING